MASEVILFSDFGFDLYWSFQRNASEILIWQAVSDISYFNGFWFVTRSLDILSKIDYWNEPMLITHSLYSFFYFLEYWQMTVDLAIIIQVWFKIFCQSLNFNSSYKIKL